MVQRLQLLAFCKSKEQEQDLYKQQTKDMNAMSGKLSKPEKQFKSSIVKTETVEEVGNKLAEWIAQKTYDVTQGKMQKAAVGFTFTCIQPVNICKKMAQAAQGVQLDKVSCHFISAYNLIRKYSLTEMRAVPIDFGVPLLFQSLMTAQGENLLDLLLA